ncbi:MAG: DUF1992 domain-containing protein [Gemmatimonadetes bacterium]|nr:DUF1992 domain-containing protein [Gemmatimonadota bacterium]
MSPRRQPDGRPEWRSVDELLAQAIASEDFATLPGKGQPLDLSAYFASGPEHRIAGKLLKDNAVLPQTLQDRRAAEQLRTQASQTLATQKEYLATLKTKICAQAPALCRFFPDRPTALDALGLPTWPEYFSEPEGALLPARRTLLDDARRLAELGAAYNRRIEVAIAEYLDSLRQANACVERLNQQVAFSRHLPAGLQLKTSDLTKAEAQVRTALPPLTPLPADLVQRLAQYYKAAHPSLWQRLS